MKDGRAVGAEVPRRGPEKLGDGGQNGSLKYTLWKG